MLKQLKRAVKAALETVRRRRSASQLSQAGRHVTGAELVADLRQLGIAAGDTLFIHSSLKSLGYVEGGPMTLVRALQEAVGTEGTLLLPTYYLPGGTIRATCAMTDYMFDPKRHGTNLGRLPEAFLEAGDIERSIHPTHSVSAWGRHAAYLTEAHHRAPSVFGIGSPWQRFVELENAKVLGLGISMGPVTFYHVLEDALGDAFPVAVWDDQTCRLPCLDHQGQRWEVPVRPFKEEVPASRIDNRSRADLCDYFKEEFENAGLRVNGKVGEAPSWFIPARGFFDHLRVMAAENLTIYSTPAQLAARPPTEPTSG